MNNKNYNQLRVNSPYDDYPLVEAVAVLKLSRAAFKARVEKILKEPVNLTNAQKIAWEGVNILQDAFYEGNLESEQLVDSTLMNLGTQFHPQRVAMWFKKSELPELKYHVSANEKDLELGL